MKIVYFVAVMVSCYMALSLLMFLFAGDMRNAVIAAVALALAVNLAWSAKKRMQGKD